MECVFVFNIDLVIICIILYASCKFKCFSFCNLSIIIKYSSLITLSYTAETTCLICSEVEYLFNCSY